MKVQIRLSISWSVPPYLKLLCFGFSGIREPTTNSDEQGSWFRQNVSSMQYLPAQSALIRCVALTFRKSKPEDTQALVAKLTRTQPTGGVAVSLQVRVDMWTASLIDVQAVSFPHPQSPYHKGGPGRKQTSHLHSSVSFRVLHKKST